MVHSYSPWNMPPDIIVYYCALILQLAEVNTLANFAGIVTLVTG